MIGSSFSLKEVLFIYTSLGSILIMLVCMRLVSL